MSDDQATQSQDSQGMRQGDAGCPSGWGREGQSKILRKGTRTIIKLSCERYILSIDSIYMVYTRYIPYIGHIPGIYQIYTTYTMFFI